MKIRFVTAYQCIIFQSLTYIPLRFYNFFSFIFTVIQYVGQTYPSATLLHYLSFATVGDLSTSYHCLIYGHHLQAHCPAFRFGQSQGPRWGWWCVYVGDELELLVCPALYAVC